MYLTSKNYINAASRYTTGSIIQEIRIADLLDTKVIVPPILVQNSIAKCLSSIDNVILSNNKENDNLANHSAMVA